MSNRRYQNFDFANTYKGVNHPDPSAPGDLANKNYVDNAILGLDDPMTVVAHSSTNVDIATLNNGDSVGGATVATGDLVLLSGQTTATEDGVYVVGATNGTTVRSTDLAAGHDAKSLLVRVISGTDAGKLLMQTASPAIVGTNGLAFTAITAGTSYTFAQGTQESGGTVTARLDGGTLSQSASGLKVADNGITATQLNTDAVTSGKIQAGAVTAAKIDQGVIARWFEASGPASAGSTIVQAHGLGRRAMIVQVKLKTGSDTVDEDVTDAVKVECDATNITVTFGASQSDRSLFRIVWVG